jgi:hypothetical protein
MQVTTFSTHVAGSTKIALLVAVLAVGMTVGAPCPVVADASADDGRGLLRYDPIADELVPVAEEERKVGCVYSRYSPSMGRRVWSVVRADGTLGYALGEGTTIEGRRLDVRAGQAQLQERIERLAPGFSYVLIRGARMAYVRLDRNGRWSLVPTAAHEAIYDIETALRWEELRGKFIPVRSTYGYNWTVQGGRYVPAYAAGHVSIQSIHDDGCGCR